MPIGVAGAVSLGAAAIGAGSSLLGSSQASAASGKAADYQMKEAIAAVNRAAPYEQAGNSAANLLQTYNDNGGFTAGQPNYLQMSQDAMPGQMTQAQLEQTPGYQFQLNQGLQSTQNSAAARGLGVSGAALKGAAAYATGLANTNYQTQFNNAQTRSQDYLNLNTGQQGNAMNRYNQLIETAKMGANASQGASTNATTSVNAAGGYLQSGGQAQAAGTVGVGNAATSAANNYLTYNMLNNLTNGTTGGYPSTANAPGNTLGMGGGGGGSLNI